MAQTWHFLSSLPHKFRLLRDPRLTLTKLGRRCLQPRNDLHRRLWVRNHFRKWCVDSEQIVITQWGFRMAISPRDYATYGIYFFGDYDPAMTRVLSCHIRTGQTVWDVGSERGWFTLVMASLVGNTGRVDSFEAYPLNAQRLRKNVELNGMSWVRINHAAVAGTSESMWFVPPSDEVTHHVKYLQHCGGVGYVTEKHQANAIPVNTITLDEYADQEQIENVSFIKMDIEGAEVSALRGARRLIQRCHPLLAVEYNRGTARRSGTSMYELDDLLDSYGYDRFIFGDRFVPLDLSLWNDQPDEETVFNVYCFPRKTGVGR